MSEVQTNSFSDSWGGFGEIPLPTSETLIGKGAFGEVYLWNKDGIQLAVKRIRVTDGSATDIVRETNIVSQLAHKHIIQCYGVDHDANYVYIITDYAEGGSLSAAKPRFDWENRKRIVVEVALGLGYLHSQGIIHRDIKGANILLTKHDEAKLCDFGLAKVMSSATCASTYMQKGTPRWMAPELKRARPKYSAMSDIFALGVVMQELAHGDDIPLDYTAIMERCLDEDPEKRPTVEEIVSALHVVHQVHDTVVGGGQVNNAEQGSSANEELKLGLGFYFGRGVDVNHAEAAERLRRAASMGHAGAQYGLGMIYRDGSGVLRDYTKAAEWFQKAAGQGYASAQRELGALYRDGGKGVLQDYCRAVDLFQAAANQGNSYACSNLGGMYLHGLGVAQSNELAIRWYREAAEQGCAVAQFNIGVLYSNGVGVEQDYEESARLMKMAAAQGQAEAQYHLGNMYAEGQGVPQDDLEAMNWWQEAAKKGHMNAQCNIGIQYINGNGVRKNPSRGRMWLKKAAEQGDEHAQYILGLLGQALVL
ncbi:kinase-like domain-containing protein [Dissophora ornata]|nr:kinase-like domain-containing protein [Dissophora ornata]